MLYNIASAVISGLPVADNNSISNNKLNTRNISIYRRVCVYETDRTCLSRITDKQKENEKSNERNRIENNDR